jgi:hypothetical protein
MSTENKSPRKRVQALNDATSGQLGEAPSDIPEFYTENQETENPRSKAARKMSRNVR